MEIGSEFDIDLSNLQKATNTIFTYLSPYHSLFTTNGRSAIRLCEQALEKGKVLLPKYICESVIQCFSQYEIIYYELDAFFHIDLDFLKIVLTNDIKVFYLCHYFGSVQPQNILDYIKYTQEYLNFTIIEDTTHSIFSNPMTIGDYCICSLRKWLPIPDGAVLYSKTNLNFLEKSMLAPNRASKIFPMILKNRYLHHHEINCNSLYRQLFTEAEQEFDRTNSIHMISELSYFLLQYCDLSLLKNKRRDNFLLLKDLLYRSHIAPAVEPGECPFTLPIFVEKRDDIREFLKSKRIYCAVHWPIDETCFPIVEIEDIKYISNHIISLPIDQRYGDKHMEYIGKVIKEYYDEKF